MEDFIFHEGQVPYGYQTYVEYTLFNKPKHLYLQSEKGWNAYYILNKKHKQIVAAIHFHVEDQIAKSPLRNPFGSIDADSIPNIVLYKFLEFITSRLKEIGVNKVIIKNPCTIYQPDHAALLQIFLFNLGYHVNDAEVSAVISVTENSFESFPDSWERRKLRQAHDAGLKFKPLSTDQLTEVYLFILACRKQRGQTLSMGLNELKRAFDQFPAHYILFSVLDEGKLAAASIAIKVKDDILYNFYSAHPNDYNQLSPVVMLIQGMYEYCQQNSISLLDLGTSALEGQPNFSLLDFKLRLGARPYAKLTFEKNL